MRWQSSESGWQGLKDQKGLKIHQYALLAYSSVFLCISRNCCWRNWKAASQEVDHWDDQMGRNLRNLRLHARVRNCCRYIESHDGGEEVDHGDDDKGDNVGKGNQDRASSAISWEQIIIRHDICQKHYIAWKFTPYVFEGIAVRLNPMKEEMKLRTGMTSWERRWEGEWGTGMIKEGQEGEWMRNGPPSPSFQNKGAASPPGTMSMIIMPSSSQIGMDRRGIRGLSLSLTNKGACLPSWYCPLCISLRIWSPFPSYGTPAI